MSESKKISKDDVIKISNLSKLKLSDNEIDLYSSQMNQIIEYISQLNKIDTTNVKPLSNVIDSTNIVRDDLIKASLDKKSSLKNAPEADGEFIIVPKIIRSK